MHVDFGVSVRLVPLDDFGVVHPVSEQQRVERGLRQVLVRVEAFCLSEMRPQLHLRDGCHREFDAVSFVAPNRSTVLFIANPFPSGLLIF